VLLVGGTSEIGLAATRALVQRRARTVVLAARSPDRAEQVAAVLRAAGAERVELLAFDALDTAAHERMVDEAFRMAGGDLDLALVAHGVLGAEAGRSLDGVADLIETNFTGAASVIAAIAQRMVGQGHGTIVVLSSVAGERARRSNFVYGSSKAGLDAFAQGLGDSLAGTGVRVMVVRPGFVRTRMTAGLKAAPLSTTADAVAAAIVRGLERDAEIVWVPAALRFVMSVVRHLPRPLFRRLPL
jgi:decaprenylphospho-beta-D-erythro-pentofuranosid-2-ulose 2-reductase